MVPRVIEDNEKYKIVHEWKHKNQTYNFIDLSIHIVKIVIKVILTYLDKYSSSLL